MACKQIAPRSPIGIPFLSAVAALLIATMAGCGKSDDAQKMATAKESTEAAMNAWKQEQPPPTTPAIVVNVGSTPVEFFDEDRQAGAKLIEYQLLAIYIDPDQTARCSVELNLQRTNGVAEKINVTYQVVSKEQKVVIARDPFS
ncbi:MAG: hypothetical protein RIS70_3673 [Planctomycetota bacterium]|jgi:flagellar basal body L-ring protein FlgH